MAMGLSARASDAGIEWCLGIGPDSNSVLEACKRALKLEVTINATRKEHFYAKKHRTLVFETLFSGKG